jgi:ligand-binding sensor domain-containing protein/signal transduction histidine kinase
MSQPFFPLIVAITLTAPSLVERVMADPLADPRIAVSSAQGGVIQARVNPRPVRLPVADASDIRFVHLSTTQGLSQSRVQQIVQDDKGFIWFGTQYGLDRYDGYKFKVFTHDSERANSLGGVFIHSLFKDRSGFLWIGSDQALDRFEPKTESFTHYRLQAPGLEVIQGAVLHINQDQEGAIWLATGAGLFRLDPTTGTMRLFQHDPSDPYSLTNSDVKSTLEDRHHRFWVADRSGLDEFDRRTGKISLHVPLDEPIREFLVYEDRYGLFWLAYASGGGAGLATFDPETNMLTRYAFASKDIPGAALTGFYAITEDHQGNLWIGTGGMGLLRLDRGRQRFLRYRNSLEDTESLTEDHVTALLEDGDCNMWVGLHSKEPNVFALRPRLFRHVIHSLGGHGGGESLVNSIYQDRRGILWIGSTSGLVRLDPQSGVSTFFRTAERGASAGVISIIEDPSGDLWLGTVGQGLKRFDPRTGSIKTYAHEDSDPSSLSDDVVRDLRFDGPGKLWMTTWDGFDELDVATERFTVYRLDPHRRTQAYHKIARDAYGNLWIGSDSGLTRFNPRNSQFTVFTHGDQQGALSSNYVNFVFIDSRDQLWVATQNGLDRLNGDGSFSTYRERDGLGGNAVSCILEDGAGNLWLSTNKGISRFDPRSRVFTSYSAADGLGDLTGWDACFRSAGGEMFFGGFSGLISFYPPEVADAASNAPVRLTELRINGQPAQMSPAGPLARSVEFTTDITLTDDQRNFSLEFASLNFLNSGATRYRYEMNGLDSQWNEVGSDQRVVSYTSLPAGTYVFRAQAAIGRGSWNEPGVELRIHVLPPWWRTAWFTTTLGAFLLLLAWVAYSYRLRSIARQFDIRLDARVSERTRIARELHDSLLQGFQGLMFRLQAVRDLLPDRATEAVQELDGALERGDRAIAEGREAVQDLRGSAVIGTDLEGSLKVLGDELDPRQSRRPASYRVLVQGRARALAPLVRDAVYRIAREAFRNALQHAQARKIEAELDYRGTAFHLRVRDDGVGIDPDVLDRGTRAGHWGLQGMRERAEALGGHLEIWSEDAAGTEVDLVIPARIAYGRSPAAGPQADQELE